MSVLSQYAGTRELVVNLTLRELRSKYKKSVLGWTWSLLNPVASVIIYTVVFSVFLKVDPPRGDPSGLKSFVVFLLCALVPWNFVAASLTLSLDSLVMNANLIKKVYFPRELLVASTIASLDVTLLIELSVLGVILLLVGNMIIPWIPLVLLLVAMLTLTLLGVGMILAVSNVYFRDVKHFMNIAIMALFYSAPIVYPVTLVPAHREVAGVNVPVRFIYDLNPLARFIEAFRAVLYDLRFPSLGTMLYLLGWTVGSLLVGWWVFGKLEPRLAEEV
jgi:ABC-type polysaccharide/polyol phosphate export permease